MFSLQTTQSEKNWFEKKNPFGSEIVLKICYYGYFWKYTFTKLENEHTNNPFNIYIINNAKYWSDFVSLLLLLHSVLKFYLRVLTKSYESQFHGKYQTKHNNIFAATMCLWDLIYCLFFPIKVHVLNFGGILN